MTAAAVRNIELLNATYEPLGRLTMQRAAKLLALGKAVVHEPDESGKMLGPWVWPKVIILVKFVKVNYAKIYGTPRLTNRGVHLRDNYTCCYCGGKATTLDHVVPRSRGGEDSWMNLVSACFKDNNFKRDRTPAEAGMTMLFQPRVPTRAEIARR